MEVTKIAPQSLSFRLLATLRRFFRWLTSPKVVLGLFMLALMIYLIIVPLYRMLETTLTVQNRDLQVIPGAVVGQFTIYHWVRMLTSKISAVMLYAPLQHSLLVSAGATLLALLLGSFMAWFVVRTDMSGRKLINGLAIIPYVMPSWTIAMAWTSDLQEPHGRWHPGNSGVSARPWPTRLVFLWCDTHHDQQWTALLHLFLLICVHCIDVH